MSSAHDIDAAFFAPVPRNAPTKSMGDVDAPFFAPGPSQPATTISALKTKSRFIFKQLFKDKHAEREPDSDNESHYSDSESSSDTSPAKPPPRAIPSDIYYWNRPRTKFIDLPLELIEHITNLLRDTPSTQTMSMAADYVLDRKHSFSEARFHISALSKTCWQLRLAVERLLYRNISLDFTAWKGRKHPGWPAGSLKLLLDTLSARPELGRYVHIAALEYTHGSDSRDIELSMAAFLRATPNLRYLFLAHCPVSLWDQKLGHLRGFAVTFAPGILPSILEDLSSLEEVHLRDTHIMSLTGTLPRHKVKRVRMDSSHENGAAYFARLLTVYGETLRELDLRFVGGLTLPVPRFHSESNLPVYQHNGAQSLRTLRLDNISVLTHLSSAYAHLLSELPVLETLHLSHHAPFALGAFRMLPPSLMTLTVSDYYGVWAPARAQEGFMKALADCIEGSTRPIAGVEGADCARMEVPLTPSKGGKRREKDQKDKEGAEKDEGKQLDITPVQDACRSAGIQCVDVKDAAMPFVRVFFGRAPTWGVTRAPVALLAEDVAEAEDE